ncbi:MAG: metallophosphoesterase [Deltaproteobacteria bacterium]|nr:metallophosphoesterase [Deltaproteobacteria bacterium]
MRLLHMTDVHFLGPSSLRGKLGKRTLGLANLWIRGRRHYFDAAAVVPAAIEDARTFSPDLFCMTGDVTALSSPAEFAEARAAFGPLLDTLPSVVIPGNHDVYTTGAHRAARMEKTFGAFMSGGDWDGSAGSWTATPPSVGPVDWPTRFRFGDVDVIATNPCRPGLRASGRFDAGAIARAEALVAESRAAGQAVVYMLHYPVLEPDGTVYRDPGHSLDDIDELVASLKRQPPHLILHGHKHTAFRQTLAADDGTDVVILGCGTTSAVSPLPERAAGYYLIDLDANGVNRIHRRRRGGETGGFVDDERLSDPV